MKRAKVIVNLKEFKNFEMDLLHQFQIQVNQAQIEEAQWLANQSALLIKVDHGIHFHRDQYQE